ncbi:winged helix DNA-binding domain-containing protein [Acrocarpospora sp. B8E8]|uniref:winged helix DNA-binding domain-containing protein n=1 Tax=Acrocarpospora sp. B8E8 TaxID=3153572 RepID=UPI00325FC4B9
MSVSVMDERALNRALLARQGLLDRLAGPVGAVVAAVGALQMQYWPALRPALWSRMEGCHPEGPFLAHDVGELLTGTLLRGTIHTVTAGEYAAYAAVAAASNAGKWWAGPDPGPGVGELTAELKAHGVTARPASELVEFVEAWVAGNPGGVSAEEAVRQREYKWLAVMMRARFVRVPADGMWRARTPAHFVAAPGAEETDVAAALNSVIRCHLRAFGPAAAEDVASWIAWNITPVRVALERMDGLVRFADETGRVLYDLPEAPRPDPDVPAPVRLLPWFDSTLLAYAPKRRTRILPEQFRDIVYVKANGQLKPTFLVDGMVAGMWSIELSKGAATLTLKPLRQLSASVRKELITEAENMLAYCQPDARSHHVELA